MLIGAGIVIALIVGAVVLVQRSRAAATEGVLVVGDSVTFLSTKELVRAFDGAPEISVQGRLGNRTDQLLPVARQYVEKVDPSVIVILTGYNDLDQRVDTSKAVNEMMDVTAGVPCSVWVLLPTKAKYPAEAAKAFNARIENLADQHPSVHVTEGWRDAVDDTSDERPDSDLISKDLIHPLPAGSQRLAQIEADAVSRQCP